MTSSVAVKCVECVSHSATVNRQYELYACLCVWVCELYDCLCVCELSACLCVCVWCVCVVCVCVNCMIACVYVNCMHVCVCVCTAFVMYLITHHGNQKTPSF